MKKNKLIKGQLLTDNDIIEAFTEQSISLTHIESKLDAIVNYISTIEEYEDLRSHKDDILNALLGQTASIDAIKDNLGRIINCLTKLEKDAGKM